MAVFARYDELKREIDALVAENEELKQLVQILRENQELKSILSNQFNEKTFLPALESPADDFLPPSYAQPGTPWGSGSPGTSNCPHGYCYECPYPWHPHVPPAPPTNADSTAGSEEGGTGSQGATPTTPTDGPQQGGEGGSNLAPLTPQTDSSAASSGAAMPATVRWERLPSPGLQLQSQPISMAACPPSPLESGAFSPGLPPMFPSNWPFPGPHPLLEGGTGFAPPLPQMDIRCRHIPMLSADPRTFPSPVPWPNFIPMGASTPVAPMLVSSFPNAFPPTPPVHILARICRPSPLQLAPPRAVSPFPFAPQRLPPGQGRGPYFSYPSPFPLMKSVNLYGPEAQAQAPGQAQAPRTYAPQKPPDAKPKERRGGERQVLSMTASKISKDVQQSTMERIVGEIAFQLDRRILSSIFPDRVRLYGFTVSNIPEKITQAGNDPTSPLSEEQRKGMMERYTDIMNQLKPLGYDPNIHPTFTEYIVNTYGILRERPDTTGAEGDTFNNLEYLQNVVNAIVPAEKLHDCRILLACLSHLSQADGKPLFIW